MVICVDLRKEQSRNLKKESLTGGWEDSFVSKVDVQNKFYDIQLEVSSRRSGPTNLYVPDKRSFTAIRFEIIESLRNFLDERLSIDDEITEIVEALSPQNLSELSNEKVRSIHQLLLTYFELREASRSIRVVADSIDGAETVLPDHEQSSQIHELSWCS